MTTPPVLSAHPDAHLLVVDDDLLLRSMAVKALRHAGFAATVRLLTTGTLPEAALDRYGETFLAAARPRPADDQLLAAFDSAALSSTAYGYALDPTGETTLGLIEADPYRGGTPRELLNAEDWASLQAICD